MRNGRWTRLVCAAAVVGALLGAATARLAPAAEGDAVTASGEVVDLGCFLTMGDKGHGPAHAECAEMCAKGGAPLGLLASDGSVLLLVADHAKPAPYAEAKGLAGKRAEVQGKRFTRGGITGLMVGAAKGL